MRYTVKNENGKYLQGREYDEIVDAFQKDKSSVEIDGRKVDIVKADMTDVEEAVIIVEVGV